MKSFTPSAGVVYAHMSQRGLGPATLCICKGVSPYSSKNCRKRVLRDLIFLGHLETLAKRQVFFKCPMLVMKLFRAAKSTAGGKK